MRSLKQLGVARDTNETKWPQGTILNQTDTNNGTPVVREVYGDVLTNVYKMLDRAGIVLTGSEDAEDTQYQVVEALDLWANSINDIAQLITESSANLWTVNMPLEILPDGYVFVGVAGTDFEAAYGKAIPPTFEGTGAIQYPYEPLDNYKVGDYLLCVIDISQDKVIVLNLSNSSSSSGGGSAFVGMGAPLAYGEGVDIQYEDSGVLITNRPQVTDVIAAISGFSGDPGALMLDMVHSSGVFVCLVYFPLTNEVHLWEHNPATTTEQITVAGFVRGDLTDAQGIYMYCDNLNFYFTNEFGQASADETISAFVYDLVTKTMNFAGTNTLNSNFVKTTNAVVKEGNIHTFVSSVLKKYDLSSTTETLLYTIPNLQGQIFKQQGKVLFSREESSVEWTI